MQALSYDESRKAEWDSLVEESGKGTFLLQRAYMEYHKQRFEDASLVFVERGAVVGILPASIENTKITSHGGLTYGPLLTRRARYADVRNMMDQAALYFHEKKGADCWLYKPIPYIYSNYPADEDIFWLYGRKANLVSRSISSALELNHALPFTQLRRRGVTKALRNGVTFTETANHSDRAAFWQVLTSVLVNRHGCTPVHSLEEMELLTERFPRNIRWFVAHKEDTVVAGTVIFLTSEVAHAQYLASSEEGRATGALDGLIQYVLRDAVCARCRYFDFGISTEMQGNYLNEGLLHQKEGFGGRAVCYDQYEIKLG